MTLLTGRGRFASDVHLDGQTYLAVRRSHEPHALVRTIDTRAALAMPGVVAVFTRDDLPETARFVYDDFLPSGLAGFGRPVLADGEVNYLGEAIAVVVAESLYAASDAAAAIEVDLEPIPAAGTLDSALAAGAALVHDHRGSNIASWGIDGLRRYRAGVRPWSSDCRGPARHESRLWSCARAPCRRRGSRGRRRQAVDLDTGRFSSPRPPRRLSGSRQGAGDGHRRERRRGFGPKGRTYPEEVLVAWAAMMLGRPVKWTASRSEDSITSMHAHGTIFELEIAGNQDGTLRGLRGRLWHDIGAYPSIGAVTPSRIIEHMLCAYRLPSLSVEVGAVFTNATPTSTVRGGGATEGNFAIERMMDRLAARLGLDPAEIRRLNLLPPGSIALPDAIWRGRHRPGGRGLPGACSRRRCRLVHQFRLRGTGDFAASASRSGSSTPAEPSGASRRDCGSSPMETSRFSSARLPRARATRRWQRRSSRTGSAGHSTRSR